MAPKPKKKEKKAIEKKLLPIQRKKGRIQVQAQGQILKAMCYLLQKVIIPWWADIFTNIILFSFIKK